MKQLRDWLRSQRRARGWDMSEMARRIAVAAGEDRGTLPNHETLTGYVRRWETGRAGVSERYQLLFVKAFSMDGQEVFEMPARPPNADQLGDTGDIIELSRQVERSDLGSGTLETLLAVKERLCRDYPSEPAEKLARRGASCLRHISGLLSGRLSLAQHRELLVTGGWLAALLGAVHYDLGNKAAAEAATATAFSMGRESGHSEIVAWSYELAAWCALVEGRYAEAVQWARTGAHHAGRTSAAVQLAAQEARAYARMEDSRAIAALRTGRHILERLPEPAYPEHHFCVDESKYDFYAASVWTWLGTHDDRAEKHARLAAAKCVLPNGWVRWPMRLSISRLDLAMIANRRGDLDEAIAYGTSALGFSRRSAMLLPRATEFGQHLVTQHPRERMVREYRDLVRTTQHALSLTPGGGGPDADLCPGPPGAVPDPPRPLPLVAGVVPWDD